MAWFQVVRIDTNGYQTIEGCYDFGDQDSVSIGRTSDNDIQVENIGVSDYHAEICRHEYISNGTRVEQFSIQDIGSTNGTKINNETLDGTRILKDKDCINFFEKLKIVYREGEANVALSTPIHSNGETHKLTYKI